MPWPDTEEGLEPVRADFTSADLAEMTATPTDLAESEAIGGERTQEGLTPVTGEAAASLESPAPGGDPDLWLYRDHGRAAPALLAAFDRSGSNALASRAGIFSDPRDFVQGLHL